MNRSHPCPHQLEQREVVYIAIALITTLIGILIVPFAWAAWTLLKMSAPQSAGVQFFMKPPDGSQVKADLWRSKMRSMIAQVSKMPAPPLSKPAPDMVTPELGRMFWRC